MTEAYPLQWPTGWPRNRPTHSRFGEHSIAIAIHHLMVELRMLGAKKIVISTNLTLRNDGLPRSAQRQPDDRAVAVYFELKGRNQCFPCDRWNYIQDNLWAIYKSIQAIRGLERWGAKDMVDAAFTGFQALPDYTTGYEDYFVGCHTLEECKRKKNKLALEHHPDKGGSADVMAEINRQYEDKKKEIHN